MSRVSRSVSPKGRSLEWSAVPARRSRATRPPRVGGLRLAALAALTALTALAACDSGPKGPGFLAGRLEGPVPLGAAIVEVRGSEVLSFEAAGSTRVFSAVVAEGVHRVVLVGETAGELHFRIEVRDPRGAPPTASLLAAADGDNLPVASVQAFRVRIAR